MQIHMNKFRHLHRSDVCVITRLLAHSQFPHSAMCVCVCVSVCEGVSVGNGLAFAAAWVKLVSVPPQQNCSFLHSGGNNPHSPTLTPPITARSSIFSCNGTYCYLAGLVESSHPVSHVGHIIGLQEVPSRKCIDDCRRRNQFRKYPH